MKLFYLIFTFLLFPSLAKSQPYNSCGTVPMDSANFENQPWYGNNQFLLDLVDSVHNSRPLPKNLVEGGFDSQAVYWIPVKTWVYNGNDGSGGLDLAQVETSIRTLNENFSGITNITGNAHPHTMIQFYLSCNISYIDNSEYTFDPSNNLVEDMFDDNHTSSMLNIHYIQTSNDFGGKANLPQENPPFCFTVVGGNFETSTMAHETGHALGLSHTHKGVCWFAGDNGDCANCHQEPVSRNKIQPVGCGNFSGDKKCEVNGDGLCDTPGDPNIDVWLRVAQSYYTDRDEIGSGRGLISGNIKTEVKAQVQFKF